MRRTDLFCVLEYDRDRAHPRIDSVYDTLGAAREGRTQLILVVRNRLLASGQKTAVAESGMHIVDEAGEVLFTYYIQRAEYIPNKVKCGRKETKGKFATRLELEEYVLAKYFRSACSMSDIARQSKVSLPVVDRIVTIHGPAYRLELEE